MAALIYFTNIVDDCGNPNGIRFIKIYGLIKDYEIIFNQDIDDKLDALEKAKSTWESIKECISGDLSESFNSRS